MRNAPIVVVTGANRGIGFEISRQLATRGAQVVLTSRKSGAGKAAVKRLAAENLSVQFRPYEVTIQARFGSTVCALVSLGLGIAIVDEFTLAAEQWPRLRALDIVEPTTFQTYVVHRKDVALSTYAARFVGVLRSEMEAVARQRGRRKITSR